MERIKLWYPIAASAEFDFKKPAGWESMSKTEKEDYAMDNMEPTGYLCHHCARALKSDFEAVLSPSGAYYDMEFYEC